MAQQAAKAVLRKAVTQVIKDVSPESIHDQSQTVAQRLLRMPEYQCARRLGVYLAIENKEIQTREVVVDALNRGKDVFVPYIPKFQGVSAMSMLALRSLEEYERLPQDKWGIPSLPSEGVSDRENSYGGKGVMHTDTKDGTSMEIFCGLDLIIMPGLAFDRELRRLGHGRGYYDRFLKQYSQIIQDQPSKSMPPLVALSLKEQLLPNEAVPTSDDDWSVNILIVGSGEMLSEDR